MLGLGWAETFLIILITLLVLGPRDIPKVMYTAGKFFRRLNYLRFALEKQFEDFMAEEEVKDTARKNRATGQKDDADYD